MNTESLFFVANKLSADIYCEFHKLVGFVEYAPQDVQKALEKNLYSVVAYDKEQPVGIARVVGDGRIVFFVKDVIVHPSHQNRGIGRLLMEQVMDYIRHAGCPNAYVGLMASKDSERFYEKFGFDCRPNEKHGSGMIQFL